MKQVHNLGILRLLRKWSPGRRYLRELVNEGYRITLCRLCSNVNGQLKHDGWAALASGIRFFNPVCGGPPCKSIRVEASGRTAEATINELYFNLRLQPLEDLL